MQFRNYLRVERGPEVEHPGQFFRFWLHQRWVMRIYALHCVRWGAWQKPLSNSDEIRTDHGVAFCEEVFPCVEDTCETCIKTLLMRVVCIKPTLLTLANKWCDINVSLQLRSQFVGLRIDQFFWSMKSETTNLIALQHKKMVSSQLMRKADVQIWSI